VITIYDAIQEVQAVVGQVAGIRFSPDAPPGQVTAFPAALCYSRLADWSASDATYFTALHTIIVEIHVPKEDLARAVATATPYGDLVVKALMAAFVAGTFTTFQTTGAIRGEFGPMDWAATETIGWKIFIEQVKIQTGVSS